MKFKKWAGLALVAVCAQAVHGATGSSSPPSQAPLLVIGASYSEGKTPFNNGVAPLGGISVGFGSYMSLGLALTRSDLLSGHVVNEAQAGGGTFARAYCAPGAPTCGPAGWDSYSTQLSKALARVAVPPTFSQYNAKYVVVTIANDCLHADAFGIPQSLAQPCTPAQLNQVVDRLVAVGQQAISQGVTPIFDVYPRYERLDLPLFRTLFGLAWVIDAHDYGVLRQLAQTRLRAELPGAVVMDIWKDFVHLGDGLHPNTETTLRAARTIALELRRRDALKP
jgi:hypothetical protein